MENYKYFAGIRLHVIHNENKHIDVEISKEEAERIVKFLTNCLEKEKG